MQICDYSSLIFAGNTAVLLMLAVTTQYWEYRGINSESLVTDVSEFPNVQVYYPFDTDSYFQITVHSNYTESDNGSLNRLKNCSFYQAPLFLHVHFEPMERPENLQAFRLKHEIFVFQQLGNLYRDCDELEDAVRDRIAFKRTKPHRCTYFYESSKSTFTQTYRPELKALEPMASACAVLCVLFKISGLYYGSRGLFLRYNNFQAFQTASWLSLLAGFSLTISLGLFQAKCQVVRQLELFPGLNIPIKSILQKHRSYTFGWSYVVAWICVLFCYTAAYVWLCKAQDAWISKPTARSSSLYRFDIRMNSALFINFMNFKNNRDKFESIVTL